MGALDNPTRRLHSRACPRELACTVCDAPGEQPCYSRCITRGATFAIAPHARTCPVCARFDFNAQQAELARKAEQAQVLRAQASSRSRGVSRPATSGPRPTVDEHFMQLADVVRRRNTCPPRVAGSMDGVGAIIARDGVQLSAGYNGAIRQEPHCSDVGHDLVRRIDSAGKESEHCERPAHAEENAVALAAREGVRTAGGTCYSTAFPCWRCYRLLVNAGIVRIVYAAEYKLDERVTASAARLGIELVQVKL